MKDKTIFKWIKDDLGASKDNSIIGYWKIVNISNKLSNGKPSEVFHFHICISFKYVMYDLFQVRPTTSTPNRISLAFFFISRLF